MALKYPNVEMEYVLIILSVTFNILNLIFSYQVFRITRIY